MTFRRSALVAQEVPEEMLGRLAASATFEQHPGQLEPGPRQPRAVRKDPAERVRRFVEQNLPLVPGPRSAAGRRFVERDDERGHAKDEVRVGVVRIVGRRLPRKRQRARSVPPRKQPPRLVDGAGRNPVRGDDEPGQEAKHDRQRCEQALRDRPRPATARPGS